MANPHGPIVDTAAETAVDGAADLVVDRAVAPTAHQRSGGSMRRRDAAITVIGPSTAAAVTLVLVDTGAPVAALLALAAATLAWWATHQLVVRPLSLALSRSEAERRRVQVELIAERADRELRARLERALRGAESEADALRIGLRAVAEAVDESDVALLLNLPDEPRIGWRVVLDGGELLDAVPVDGTPQCSALASGAAVVTPSTRSFEACAHVRELDDEVAAACLPLPGGEGTVGTVCVTTAPGEQIEPALLDRLEWIVERMGLRAAEHRAARDEPGEGRSDPLTGLPMREVLRPHLRELVRSLTPFCLAVVEIDHFDDLITDEEADAAVTSVAEVLCDTVRPDDLICRVDTAAFAAVLPSCSSDEAVAVMERVREHLVLLLTTEDGPAITCSAGVVESRDATSLDEIVGLATTACDEARSAGGNRVAIGRGTRHL